MNAASSASPLCIVSAVVYARTPHNTAYSAQDFARDIEKSVGENPWTNEAGEVIPIRALHPSSHQGAANTLFEVGIRVVKMLPGAAQVSFGAYLQERLRALTKATDGTIFFSARITFSYVVTVES